jgi:hypothetical protein
MAASITASRTFPTREHRVLLAARLRHGHLGPLTLLAGLTVLMMRNWLWIGDRMPAAVDAGFLYSTLPYFQSHGLHAFTVWLSAPLGEVQQYSIYWFLGMWSGVVRDPLLLFRAACFLTALVSAYGLYGLTFWLTRSRLAATTAAIVYAFCPIVVSHWLAGHLNVQISIAVGPLAIWALLVSLRDRSLPAMLGLGLCASTLYLLTTGQAYYWAIPFTAVSIVELNAISRRDGRLEAMRRVAAVAAIAVPTFVLASAIQLVPLSRGAVAPFATGAQRLYIESLPVHAKYSLPFWQGVAGVPRESWLDANVSLAAWPFDSLAYRAAAASLILLAFGALATSRRRLATALITSMFVTWLLAAGPDGPARLFYLLLYDHVPYFRLLRVPNRWLIVAGFSTAVSIGLFVAERASPGTRSASPARWARLSSKLDGRRAAGAAVIATVLVSLFAFQVGLPTWSPPPAYARTYSALAAEPGDWRILTTPFYQAWMATGSPYGDDMIYAADLGYSSGLWTGRPTIGRGGWDPRAARFVDYLYELTQQGLNRDVSKILGAVGVRFIGLNPHAANEVVTGQNGFFRSQDGVVPFRSDQGIQLLVNRFALPPAYVTSSSCVVAGGLNVLGDLAQDRDFRFSQVGIEFADQLAAVGGISLLLRELQATGCLIVGAGGGNSLRVLLRSVSSARLDTIAPSAWPRLDVGPSLDSQADASTAVEIPPEGIVQAMLQAPADGRYQLWIRGDVNPDQGTVSVTVDGHAAGTISLSAGGELGVRWLPGGSVDLSAGTHEVALRVSRGGNTRVIETALLPASASGWSPEDIDGVRLIEQRSSDAYTLEGQNVLDPKKALSGSAWSLVPGTRTRSTSARPHRLMIDGLRPDRRYFTIARTRVAKRLDPTVPFGIRFDGAATGQYFYLNFLFDSAGYNRASFRFQDVTTVPRTLFFFLQHPSSVTQVPDWSNVRAISLSTNSKDGWSDASVRLRGPFAVDASIAGSGTFHEPGRRGDPFSDMGGDVVSALASPNERVTDVTALRPGLGAGLLTFTQSYHPSWQLTTTDGGHEPVVALGFANGYRLTEDANPIAVKNGLAVLGRIGTAISGVAWFAALVAAASLARRRRRRRTFVPDG